MEYADSISGDSEIDRVMYEIECVFDHRDICCGREYLVCWKGYIAKDDTWKPSQVLKCAPVLVKDYETCLQAQQRFKGYLGVPKRHLGCSRKQAPPASVIPEVSKRHPGRPQKNAAPPPTNAVSETQESL